MPLLNLQDYTGPQLAFYATGAYLWVVAYLIYIRNGFKYRMVEMPAFAACSNIGWEVNWALLFTSDLGALSVWAHKAWLGLDVIIFSVVLHVPGCLSVCSGPLRDVRPTGLDVRSTIQSAYICQLPISFLYVPLMLRQKSLVGWSLWTAWTRILGTGLIGVFAFMRYPDQPFLLAMAVISTAVDFLYIYLFTTRRHALTDRECPQWLAVGCPTNKD